MTEENARHGDAGLREGPPAGDSGHRSAPAAPRTVPPRPSTPPTSATPVVTPVAPAAPSAAPGAPAAAPSSAPLPSAPEFTLPRPVRPTVPPVNRDGGRAAGSRAGSRSGARSGGSGSAWTRGAASATKAASGAGTLISERAVQLGSWIRRQGQARTAATVAGVVVLGLLVWWLTSLAGGERPSAAESAPAPAAAQSAAPASRGPLPLDGVGPLDFQLGDCFKDFDPEAPTSTVVDCATGHSAQLIAIHEYQPADAYPGLNALKDKGRETCRNARLSAAATNYDLQQRNAYPSSTSWDKGDRRVDCYVTAVTGNTVMETLMP